jgi:hypothetical protein
MPRRRPCRSAARHDGDAARSVARTVVGHVGWPDEWDRCRRRRPARLLPMTPRETICRGVFTPMSLSPLRLDGRRHRPSRGSTVRTRPAALAVGAVALLGVVGLAACEKPAPDGRDLAVQVNHLPQELRVGGSVTVRGTLANLGTTDADAIHFRIGSTPNLELSLVGEGIGTCSTGAHVVDCRLDEGSVLAAGETVEFTVEVEAIGLGEAAFGVLATSPAGEPDPDPASNAAYHELQVEVPAPSAAVVTGRTGAAPGPFDPTAGQPFDVASSLAVTAGTVDDLVVTQTFPAGTELHGTYGFAEGWDPDAGELVQHEAECLVVGRSVSCRFAGPISSSIAMDRFWVVTGVTATSAGDLVVDLDLVASDPAGGGPARFSTTDAVTVLPG